MRAAIQSILRPDGSTLQSLDPSGTRAISPKVADLATYALQGVIERGTGVAAALETDVAVTVRFIDAVEARKLNRTYRAKDYATNVLSFVYDAECGVLRGDVALCGWSL